jgi:hypothetical protein
MLNSDGDVDFYMNTVMRSYIRQGCVLCGNGVFLQMIWGMTMMSIICDDEMMMMPMMR